MMIKFHFVKSIECREDRMEIEDYINIVILESQLEAGDQSFMRLKVGV